tara:strand:+ start:74 stop:1396 length:1323 start_codon:yes stop_codon:yes gene_type:complete
MMFFSKEKQRTVALLLVAGLWVGGCGDDDDDDNIVGGDGDGGNVDVPTAYSFDSRFETGSSSVSYSGQVVRNLLVQDLKIFIGNLGKAGAQPITVDDLLAFYEYDDALDLTSLSGVGGKVLAEPRYSAISTGKNLVGKISDDIVIGTGKNADTLVREWFEIIAANSQDASKLGTPAVYTDDNGVDLAQMINKLLIGAVTFYQSTGVYMDGLLDRDNSEARNGTKPYTAMEHAWDEAFGYFGAARDYARYTDDQLAGGVEDYTFDSNGDGTIDFKSEYNFGLSRNAGKRDKGGTGVNLTKEIFDAFLTGRALISSQGTVSAITEQRQIAANGMEKVLAATVVHYINDTLDDMADIGTSDENLVKLNKHWAEMRAFTMALQYSPFRLISGGQLAELAGIMGNAPSYGAPGSDAYNTTLRNYARAKDVLQSAYGFSDTNIANW